MLLPIEEYALYDDKLMSRIGDDIFELRLPVTNPSGAPSALALDPTLRVRVTPNADHTRATTAARHHTTNHHEL